ncbi:MAG: hypothetical protein LBL81_02240, partial [Tannerella sp.]|nr:hypothetical protein [Tannerella sp.]
QTAIQNEPNNVQLQDVLGRVYENSKDMTNAEAAFKKAVEIAPDNTDALSDLGRVYYNRAINQQNEANAIQDQNKYKVEVAKAKDIFRQALPYFEKVHQLKPDDRECLTALRGIYYNLNMNDKFNEIEAEMNKSK